MGNLFGMPKMPDPAEMQKQQLEMQRSLQADADSRATAQLAEERKKRNEDKLEQVQVEKGDQV